MLALRPSCECCDADLPPDSDQAVICTFECTFCRECAAETFSHVCPNCGGGLVTRPIRPAGLLSRFPASSDRVLKDHPGCTKVA